ncbi:Alternative cytochrome c oxidase polypeptide CoxO [Hyphomicrobiales bacterium]|nr:Alternative cytochrome c oxidase polypeptide CoxO [Hyphomicrobiales bacterium]CAH1699470.1 Alternative cytochrome c oxidase polypeptide CoxO [Hyphomicrobiales bacterium]CAI0343257.1 Cytochrome-c oxidase [Hyphomicrobiales bacterium]
MGVVLGFMVIVAGFAGWWLSRQHLTSKPWLEVGVIGDAPEPRSPMTAKLGLGTFLVVVGSLFALLVSAYSMRMGMADWRALPMPTVLWFSTGLLILASVALHMAVIAARCDEIGPLRSSLLAAGVCSLAFLSTQGLAWRELAAAGFFAAANPASAFFYLVTAIHGAHLLGGLVALGRTAARAFAAPRDLTPRVQRELALSVELCAIYWHFLLLVWLVLFSLLMRWTDDIIAICRGLLS